MSDQRRYTEDEVKAILERATDGSLTQPRAGDAEQGLTLAEIQEIGAEVGIDKKALAHAARTLERPRDPKPILGIPLSVGRTVDLPRDLTDLEWERLVGELRETFRAPGEVHQLGRVRQWKNGRLYALVEPTPHGYRLSLGTTNGNALGLLGGGGGVLAVVAVLTLLFLAGRVVDAQELVVVLGLLGSMGLGLGGAGLAILPKWAKERRAQMEHIVRHVESSLQALPPSTGEDGADTPPTALPDGPGS